MTVEIWGKTACPFCEKAKQLAEQKNLDYSYKTMDVDFIPEEFFAEFPTARTFPQIKVDGKAVGGYEDFAKTLRKENDS